jgi:hypothetical protein
METAVGIVVVAALCIALLVWRSRETPAQRAERAATIRWYRQHRPQIKAALKTEMREREGRINEIAEGVRRGTRGW